MADPPYRFDPFQNPVSVHWGASSPPESTPAHLSFSGTVGASTGAKLGGSLDGSCLAACNAECWWSQWHGHDTPPGNATFFTATGSSARTSISLSYPYNNVSLWEFSPSGGQYLQYVNLTPADTGNICTYPAYPFLVASLEPPPNYPDDYYPQQTGLVTVSGSSVTALAWAWTNMGSWEAWGCEICGLYGGKVNIASIEFDWASATVKRLSDGATWEFDELTNVQFSGQQSASFIVKFKLAP